MSYYHSQRSKLLKDFDATARLMRDDLAERYGQNLAETLSREVRREYEHLIPVVPFIEGLHARALNVFLRITVQEVAAYKAMKKRGKGPSDTWAVRREAIERGTERFPAMKRWLVEHLMHSSLLMGRVRRRAERQEPFRFGDFRIRYLVGDGTEFDWGVDDVGCRNYNFFKAQCAKEFDPYKPTNRAPETRNGDNEFERTC